MQESKVLSAVLHNPQISTDSVSPLPSVTPLYPIAQSGSWTAKYVQPNGSCKGVVTRQGFTEEMDFKSHLDTGVGNILKRKKEARAFWA